MREGLDNSFERIAREWLELQEKKFARKTYEKTVWTFETLTFPFIGKRPIDRIATSRRIYAVHSRPVGTSLQF